MWLTTAPSIYPLSGTPLSRWMWIVDANSRKNMLDGELGCHPCLAVRDCRTILHVLIRSATPPCCTRVDSHRSPGGLHHQPYAGRSPTSPPRSRFPTTSSVRLLPVPGQSPFFSNPLTFIWTTGQDCSQPRGGETSDVGARSAGNPRRRRRRRRADWGTAAC
jgi:hypothetical protein